MIMPTKTGKAYLTSKYMIYIVLRTLAVIMQHCIYVEMFGTVKEQRQMK
jgi:hypothetical protein